MYVTYSPIKPSLSLVLYSYVSYSSIDVLHSVQLVISCRKKNINVAIFFRDSYRRTTTVCRNWRQSIVFGYTCSIDYDGTIRFHRKTIQLPICIKRKVPIDRATCHLQSHERKIRSSMSALKAVATSFETSSQKPIDCLKLNKTGRLFIAFSLPIIFLNVRRLSWY